MSRIQNIKKVQSIFLEFLFIILIVYFLFFKKNWILFVIRFPKNKKNGNKYGKNINGYSNDFWGWGVEDVELKNRAVINNINIDKTNFILRGENNSLIKDPVIENKYKNMNKNSKKLKKDNYLINKNNVYNDGLTNCNYHILKKNVSKDNEIIRLLVDV